MGNNNEDFLIVKVDKDLLERLRITSGANFPAIERVMSEELNRMMGAVLREYALKLKARCSGSALYSLEDIIWP